MESGVSKSNEPAFPSEAADEFVGGFLVSGKGLTKRECFAAMALQGLSGHLNVTDRHETLKDLSSRIARVAVMEADALLAELEKNK